MFVHTNILHLSMNSLFFLIYWRLLRSLNLRVVLPIVVVSAVVAPMLACGNTPTVGLSAVVMAMSGIITIAFNNRSVIWRTVALLSATSVITWLFAPSINTGIHVYAFGIATLLSLAVGRRIYAT